MKRKRIPMKPWKGWAVVDNETNRFNWLVYGPRRPRQIAVERATRVVRVEVREVLPKRKATP